MTQEITDYERPVPYWVGLSVAVLLFGSIGLFGMYWVWARATQPGPKELVEVPAIPQARASVAVAAQPQSGIQRAQGAAGQITYTIRAPEAILTVTKSTAQPQWTYTFGYNRSDLMTPDQTAAATARFRLMNDVAFARSLKLSDEQVNKLKAVPPVTTMIVSDADQAAIKAAFEAYDAQQTPANEQVLTKLLADIAARSLAPTRASIAAKVAQIHGILSPEQIAPFKTQ